METTTTTAPSAAFYTWGAATDLTAADLRQMADLLDAIGQPVRIEGFEAEGLILTDVYWSDDSVAVNASNQATGSFHCGPLYGAGIEVLAR